MIQKKFNLFSSLVGPRIVHSSFSLSPQERGVGHKEPHRSACMNRADLAWMSENITQMPITRMLSYPEV